MTIKIKALLAWSGIEGYAHQSRMGTKYRVRIVSESDWRKLQKVIRDAERYRWLRRKDREFINEDCTNFGAIDSVFVCEDIGLSSSAYEEELDKAIDDQRAKEALGKLAASFYDNQDGQ